LNSTSEATAEAARRRALVPAAVTTFWGLIVKVGRGDEERRSDDFW